MKRVLYFSRNLTTHDLRFLSSLAETDHEVTFLRLENKKTGISEQSLPKNIKCLTPLNQKFRYSDIFENIKKLKQIIIQNNPQIIHAGPIQSCGFLVALTGFGHLVTMSWGSDILVDSERNLILKWITKYTLQKTSILIADCSAVENKATEFNFPRDRIVKFPWGIDLEKFQPGNNDELRHHLGWNDNFVILSLRSWEKIYGVDLVVKAFAKAVKKEPNLRLILLGSGSMEAEIKQLLDENQMNGLIFQGGMVKQMDLPDYYHAADLYISASYSDGSSVSLMEALGSGLPVLISDIPGNKEWIEDGVNGWHFKTGNCLDLATSIINVYEKRSQLEEIRSAARKTAETKANWQINFQKLLLAYDLASNSVAIN